MLEVRFAEANRETPVTVEWLPEVQLRGDITPHVQIGPVYLEPHTGAGWRVVVRRQDGERFLAGEYVITFWMHQLLSAVRTTDDRAWTGRVFDGPGKVALVVNPATTPGDRAKMHNMRAREATMRRAFLEALDAYSLASAADPANIEAREGAGYVYMSLRRYREAIAQFETVVPAFSNGLSPARLTLARAYMAINDEAGAVRVLRGSGLPEERINLELSQLRQEDLGRNR
jgi:tetratricopeptide (TPR) repeat protein